MSTDPVLVQNQNEGYVKNDQEIMVIPIEGAIFKVPSNKWSFDDSKILFNKKVPIFQNRKIPKLIGNLFSEVKLTNKNEIFNVENSMTKFCSELKDIYTSIDKEIKESRFKVQLFNENIFPTPFCMIRKVTGNSVRNTLMVFTYNHGKYVFESYNLHTFTFNYKTEVKVQAEKELLGLMKNIVLLSK
jgi:hypothetical protein